MSSSCYSCGSTGLAMLGAVLSVFMFSTSARAIEAEAGTMSGAARVVSKSFMSGGQDAGGSVTYGHTILSSSSAQFWVNNEAWADVHYYIPGHTPSVQNIRMTHSGGNNTYTLNSIPSGATVQYYFTVAQGTGAFDTRLAGVHLLRRQLVEFVIE